MGIYRRAVLDRTHFASLSEYRRLFIRSYLEFKRWLRSHEREGNPSRIRASAPR